MPPPTTTTSVTEPPGTEPASELPGTALAVILALRSPTGADVLRCAVAVLASGGRRIPGLPRRLSRSRAANRPNLRGCSSDPSSLPGSRCSASLPSSSSRSAAVSTRRATSSARRDSPVWSGCGPIEYGRSALWGGTTELRCSACSVHSSWWRATRPSIWVAGGSARSWPFSALHEGAVVGADTLIDRVWGDDAPASVAKSLTTQLARLRRILEPWGWVLHHTGGGYQLRVGASSLDVREFETLVDGARHAAALDRPEVATGLLERALLLWRGHPLADLADAPFVADAALRLEEEKGEAEDLLTTVLERSGALNRLITLLDRLVDETPFREDRWARLVRAPWAEPGGGPTRCRPTSECAGSSPTSSVSNPATIYARPKLPCCSHARPGRGRRGPACTPSSAGWPRPASSTSSWSVFRGGGSEVVVVTGESGIGKSRLVHDFAAHARGARRNRAHGRVCDRASAVPMHALLQALAPALDDALLAALGPTTDDLLFLVGRVDEPSLADGQLDERARRFVHAVGRAIVGLAQMRPTVLVIDDVQWADGATRSLLQSITSEEPGLELLVVCTLRSSQPSEPAPAGGDIDSYFVDLARTTSVTWLALPALAPDEVCALVDAITGSHADDALVERVRRASGGNPLYAIQLTRLLGGADGTMPQPLPRDLTAVLRARVAEIDSDARDTLRVAAVIGEEFSVTVLAAVLGREELGVAHARRDRVAGPVWSRRPRRSTNTPSSTGSCSRWRTRISTRAAGFVSTPPPPVCWRRGARPDRSRRRGISSRRGRSSIPKTCSCRSSSAREQPPKLPRWTPRARCTPWRSNASRASARTRRRS